MQTFIFNHINPSNTIIIDGQKTYRFLDKDDSLFIHEVYIHGPKGNFGLGIHSTSHIEVLWGTLKNKIKSIYNYILSMLFYFQGKKKKI